MYILSHTHIYTQYIYLPICIYVHYVCIYVNQIGVNSQSSLIYGDKTYGYLLCGGDENLFFEIVQSAA